MSWRRLQVTVTDGRGRSMNAVRLRRWLANVAPRSARGDVVIALVCDRKMRSLNHRYRGVDCATDVLSFPVVRNEHGDALVRTDDRYLGDIVIATGVARRQARASGHRLSIELRLLALHGLLHLLGYDHEHDSGQMKRFESRLRHYGGLT